MQILNNIIFCLDNDWEAQMTKDIMEKAKEITDQIFSGELDIWIEEKKKTIRNLETYRKLYYIHPIFKKMYHFMFHYMSSLVT